MSEIIKQNMNRIDELEPNTVFFDSSRTGRQAAVKSLKKQVYKYDVSLAARHLLAIADRLNRTTDTGSITRIQRRSDRNG